MMANTANQKVILISGMHRSGTSVLAAGVQYALDVNMQAVDDHKGEDNPKGYFENIEIVDLNEKILRYLGSSWDSLFYGKAIDFSESRFDSFCQEALHILNKYYGNCRCWGVKDPRFSVLLPFWGNVIHQFGSKLFHVIALRHPLEVAFSQKIRHEQFPEFHVCGEDLQYTLNLWFWYNLRLLKTLPDDNNIIVEYKKLLADPPHEMQRIGRLIDVEVDPEGLREYQHSFLEKQLRHHDIDESETEPFLDDYGHVFELYSRMKQHANKDRLPLKEARRLLDGMPDDHLLQSWAAPIYSYVNTVKSQMSELQAQAQTLEEQKADIGNQLIEAKSESQELINALSLHKQTVTDLELKCVQQEKSLGESSSLLLALQQKVAALESDVSQKDQSLQEAASSLSALEQKVTDLEEVISQKDRSLQEAAASLSALEQKVTDLEEVISQKDRSLQEAAASLSVLEQKVTDLEEVISQKDRSLQEAAASLSALEQKVTDLEEVISQKDLSLSEMNISISEKDRLIAGYREELYSVYASHSWRYTWLFRKVGDIVRGVQRLVHRPRMRSVIKKIYFRLPRFIRSSRFIENRKVHFKSNETMR